LHVAAPLKPISATPDLASDRPQNFKGLVDGVQLMSSVPVVKAALTILGELWPQAARVAALPALARQRLGLRPAAGANAERQDLTDLASTLMGAYVGAGDYLATLYRSPPVFTDRVSERPMASPLARLQAVSELPITNLRHGTATLDPFDLQLLPLLDGTRERPALLQDLVQRFQQGALNISVQFGSVKDLATAQALISSALDQHLLQLAKAAVLLA
jgi:hypothetical protein